MTENEIVGRVRQYIVENFLYMRRDYSFADTDSLLERGIIDSMGVIELITFVQDEFAIEIEDGDVTEEHFGTLEAIAQFVQSMRAEHLAP